MLLYVELVGTLSVTGRHSSEDVGHLEGGGGEGQGLSCVDTSHFTLLPGVRVFFSAVLGRRKIRTPGKRLDLLAA